MIRNGIFHQGLLLSAAEGEPGERERKGERERCRERCRERERERERGREGVWLEP